ncbi:MAG: hypothetical protein PHP44_14495 [Kiritimatiellae bacterium]|nr:hypothetical protein [Kiritimatiellia bacterium]
MDPAFTDWLDTNSYIQTESDPVFTNWLDTTYLSAADLDVFFYHEAAVDGNSAIVVADFGDYSSTPPKMAFGGYSTATNALQSMVRGAILRIPSFITHATNIRIQVFGSSTNAAETKLDVTLYHPDTTDTASFTDLRTSTAGGWTTHNLPTSGTFLTNNLAGKAVRVRCRPYCWKGHTSAVERIWRIMQ